MPSAGDFMCGADTCSTGGALLAQEPVAFRTVVTTGASALKVQMPAAAPPRLRGHGRRLLSRPVTTFHSRPTRPVRCVHGFGQGGICCHSWSVSFPGWANEMACLQRMQTGAIPASLIDSGLDGGHAFGDCSSRQPRRATPGNPCRMRGNPIYRSGLGYHRLLHGSSSPSGV